MKSRLLCFVLLFVAGFGTAQERKIMEGEVMTDQYPVNDVLVVNVSAQREVRTDGQGRFKLAVKEGDSIAVVDFKIISRELVLTAKDVKESPLVIVVEAASYMLEEVVVDAGPKINAVTLGLIPEDMKMPNRTERREYAENTDVVGSVITAFSRNKKINGRLLKEAEENVRTLEFLENLFDDSFYKETLKIEDAFIEGFKYYAAGSKKLTAVLYSGKTELIQVALIELSQEYIKIQADEK